MAAQYTTKASVICWISQPTQAARLGVVVVVLIVPSELVRKHTLVDGGFDTVMMSE